MRKFIFKLQYFKHKCLLYNIYKKLDILHAILNNGYSPYLIRGYGGLGYKPPNVGRGGLGYKPPVYKYIPPIVGNGLDEGDIVAYNKGLRTNEIFFEQPDGDIVSEPFNENTPTDVLWSYILNPSTSVTDRSIITKDLQYQENRNSNKFIEDTEEYAKRITDENKRRGVLELANDIKERNNPFFGLSNPRTHKALWNKYFPKPKKTEAEISKAVETIKNFPLPEEGVEVEEVEEEVSAIDEEELALNETALNSITVLENEIASFKKDLEKLRKNFDRAITLNKVEEANKLAEERNRIAVDVDTRKKMIEAYKNPTEFLQDKAKPSENKELDKIANEELDIESFPDEAQDKYKGVLEYFNDNDFLMYSIEEQPEMKKKIYTATTMNKTILKSSGEGAGKSLESNISTPTTQMDKPSVLQRKIAEAITGQKNSLINALDPILKGKKYSGYTQFCYDNYDKINNFIIECKKYDADYNFAKIYSEFVEDYNNYFLELKKEIINLNKEYGNIFEEYEKIENFVKGIKNIITQYNNKRDITDYLRKFKVKDINGLKKLLKEKEEELEEMDEDLNYYEKAISLKLSSISNEQGQFDEKKFKTKFYRNCEYTGVTVGINKFPMPIKWAGAFNSANSEKSFNEIKRNRHTNYNIDVVKRGEDIGYINNIAYESAAKSQTKAVKEESVNKNNIIEEIFGFKENYYSLMFLIACDDALLTFDYTEFIQGLDNYEDITNLFRGVYTKYDHGGAKYDSIVIPIDCFKLVNLKEVYGDDIKYVGEKEALVKQAKTTTKAKKETKTTKSNRKITEI